MQDAHTHFNGKGPPMNDRQIQEFAQGYMEGLLFTTEVGEDFAELWEAETGQAIPATARILRRFGITPAMLHWHARAQIEATCETFVLAHLADLRLLDAQTAGADLWLSRNGLGGYATRRYGPAGDRLHAAALRLGMQHAYVIAETRTVYIAE